VLCRLSYPRCAQNHRPGAASAQWAWWRAACSFRTWNKSKVAARRRRRGLPAVAAAATAISGPRYAPRRAGACIKELMKTCEIFHVPHKSSFRWKWRYVAPDGRVSESKREYQLFYECVSAARESGYEPQKILPTKAAA